MPFPLLAIPAALLLFSKKTPAAVVAPLSPGDDTASAPPSLDVVGLGNFDGDGSSLPLVRNLVTGEVSIARPDGSFSKIGVEDDTWAVIGIGDADKDGFDEPIWKNKSTGEIRAWLHAGGSIALPPRVAPVAPTNSFAAAAAVIAANKVVPVLTAEPPRSISIPAGLVAQRVIQTVKPVPPPPPVPAPKPSTVVVPNATAKAIADARQELTVNATKLRAATLANQYQIDAQTSANIIASTEGELGASLRVLIPEIPSAIKAYYLEYLASRDKLLALLYPPVTP